MTNLQPEENKEVKYYFANFNFSLTKLPPGEIINADYISPGTTGTNPRTLLVISTKRAPVGNFISTRNNTLLCVIQLNSSLPSFKIILKLFHKKDNRCTYDTVPKFLKQIFGLAAFKTLIILNTSNVKILLTNQHSVTRDKQGRLVTRDKFGRFSNRPPNATAV
jgi:hypothetical protein